MEFGGAVVEDEVQNDQMTTAIAIVEQLSWPPIVIAILVPLILLGLVCIILHRSNRKYCHIK